MSEVIDNIDNYLFIEPSAGSGSFVRLFKQPFLAFDIAPEGENIVKQDFLSWDGVNLQNVCFIGNPPFGKRSKLAIEFFNHAASFDFTDIIAFIVPVSFMKYNVQKLLNKEYKLISYDYLPENSFTDNGKDYDIRTVFQIWVKKSNKKDLRILKPPPIVHPDFNIWQYNATPQSLSVIDKPWEICLYRQGYYDYNTFFFQKDKAEIFKEMTNKPKKQFFFIQPTDKKIFDFLLTLDYNNLAARNTVTPGFGKGDFVSFYIENLEKENIQER